MERYLGLQREQMQIKVDLVVKSDKDQIWLVVRVRYTFKDKMYQVQTREGRKETLEQRDCG